MTHLDWTGRAGRIGTGIMEQFEKDEVTIPNPDKGGFLHGMALRFKEEDKPGAADGHVSWEKLGWISVDVYLKNLEKPQSLKPPQPSLAPSPPGSTASSRSPPADRRGWGENIAPPHPSPSGRGGTQP